MQTCPRDKADLVLEKVRGFSVSHCKTCSGLWLPPALVANAVGHLPQVTPHHSPKPGKQCRCPADGSVLQPVFHRGVEIDVCTICGGVWLDRGELDVILRCKREDSGIRYSVGKENIPDLAIEAGGEILTNPALLGAVGDFAGEAIGAVLSFVAEALSGF